MNVVVGLISASIYRAGCAGLAIVPVTVINRYLTAGCDLCDHVLPVRTQTLGLGTGHVKRGQSLNTGPGPLITLQPIRSSIAVVSSLLIAKPFVDSQWKLE